MKSFSKLRKHDLVTLLLCTTLPNGQKIINDFIQGEVVKKANGILNVLPNGKRKVISFTREEFEIAAEDLFLV